MPGAYRDQKKVLSALELEIQIAVSHHVGAGPEPSSSAKTARALHQRATSPAPVIHNFICVQNVSWSSTPKTPQHVPLHSFCPLFFLFF